MFGFGKKKKRETAKSVTKPEKKKTRVDKIVMGAILGVAIGSVVSASMAPKKEEQKEKEVSESKGFFSFFKRKNPKRRASLSESPRKIPTELE